MAKAKVARTPREQHVTERQKLLECLGSEPLGARELSKLTSMSEKDVYEHIPHIEKSLLLQGKRLIVQPAECMKCGFVFEKKGRFNRPGRCPECKHERISPPTFAVWEQDNADRFDAARDMDDEEDQGDVVGVASIK